MKFSKRTTIQFEEGLHQALQIKAAETGRSISDIVNCAVEESLLDDAVDLEVFRERANEPTLPFEAVAPRLRSRR